ncbi:MAG: PAS domain S-box protein [Anaerolineales bacterium]|nr:PAS domain S-box protein [Anaerolineales bacterium]
MRVLMEIAASLGAAAAVVVAFLVLFFTRRTTDERRSEINPQSEASDEATSGRRILLSLSQAAQAVQRARTPDQVYQTVGDEIGRLGFRAIILALTSDRSHLGITYLSHASHLLRAMEKLAGLSMRDYRIPLKKGGIYQQIINIREPIYAESGVELTAQALPAGMRHLASRLQGLLGDEQGIYAPLVVGGEVHGILGVTAAGLTEADVPAIMTFASQIAIALENVQAMEALRLPSEIMANMSEGVYLIRTSDETIVYTNPKFDEMFGFSHGEMLGKHVSIVNAPSDKRPEETAREIISTLKQQGHWQGQVRNIRKDGTLFWCFANVSEFEHREFGHVWVSIHTDITEHKLAEEELQKHHQYLEEMVDEQAGAIRASEAKLRALLAALPDTVLVLNDEGRLIKIVSNGANLLDRPAAELEGRLLHDILPLEAAGIILHQVREALDHGEMVNVEYYLPIGNRVAWFSGVISPITKNSGLWTVRDVTERKHIEDALRDSEERFRAIFEQAAVGVAQISPEGRFLRINQRYCDIVGYTLEEMMNLTFQEITYPDDLEFCLENTRQVLTGEIPTYSIEKRYIRQDGEVVWVNLTVSLVHESSGASRYFVCVIEDITLRKRAQDALRESEELYRDLVEYSQDLICTHDLEGKLLSVNLTAARVLGYAPDEIVNRNMLEMLPEGSEDGFQAYLTNIREQGVASGLLNVFSRSGKACILEYNNNLSQVEGEPPFVRGVARDVTDRIRAEKASRAQLERISRHDRALAYLATKGLTEPSGFQDAAKAITQAAGEATGVERVSIWLLDDKGQQMTSIDLYNLETGRHLGGEIVDITRYPNYTGALKANRVIDAADAVNDPRTSDLHDDYLTPLGITAMLDATIRVAGKMVGVVCFEKTGKDDNRSWQPDELVFAREVADQSALALLNVERQQALVALQKSEEQYRSLVETDGAGVISIDMEGKLIFTNQGACHLFGYSREEMLGRPFIDFLYPEEAGKLLELFQNTFQNPETRPHLEFKIRCADGSMAYGYTIPTLIWHSGQIIGASAIIHDISDRKQAEEALQDAEMRYRSLVEQIPAIIYTDSAVQVDKTFYISPQLETTLGYAPEEWIADNDLWLKIMHPDDRERVTAENDRVNESGEPFSAEYRVITPEGRIVWIRDEAMLNRDSSGRPLFWQGILLDITEQKQAEEALQHYSERLEEMVEKRTKALEEAHEQLLRKEKLTVLGQLASGVGHELRQPLAVIKNVAYLMNLLLKDPVPEVRETLDMLDKEVQTADRIIHSLLNYARTGRPVLRETNLNDVAHKALSRLTLSDDVHVLFELDDTLPPILADADQLVQVCVNLFENAVQAMPQGGQLLIKTTRPLPTEVTLSISDMGMGIPEENLDKVFEPLFSTKARGIGLGLALVKMLVEAHGGSVQVTSVIGQGSTFKVSLPAVTGGSMTE